MRSALVFLTCCAVWWSSLHLFLRPEPSELVVPLARSQLAADTEPLRRFNPEWDLMSRMFRVLAFANLSLKDESYLKPLTELALETDALERRHGPTHFLLPYGAAASQSLFVDGEIAVMLAAKQLRAGGDASALRDRVQRIERALRSAPNLFAESYPDEGWVFCNTVALAALKMSDAALGTDHSPLLQAWVTSARAHLVDPQTGLLISSFHRGGAPRDGPEGSTLWLAAHMLQLVDRPFAEEQYRRARAALARSALGFGWAAEWPRQWVSGADIDSGPTIPLLEANAGSSGLAVLGAAAFGDRELLTALLSSLHLAGFPLTENGQLRFAAGNALADAVVLYALVQGPLWACLEEGTCSAPRS